MTYWHFCSEDRRLGYNDGREIRVGETLKVEGQPVLYHHGLHACRRLIDALKYARGPILCEVALSGTVVHGDGKSVATERTVLRMADATDVLRAFARRCALDVIHLWDAPKVVKDYLKSGDKSIRAAAGDATWAAAGDAAGAATWAATWAAARAAVAYAAWPAANAAWAAAGDKQNRRLVQMVRWCDWEVV